MSSFLMSWKVVPLIGCKMDLGGFVPLSEFKIGDKILELD
jgi:hypothetical protein